MTARDYAKSLKRQNVVLGIVLVLSVALIIFLGETGWLDSRDWTRAAEGAQKLLFVWQGWMIWRIVRNRRLLREPGEMKQYMVEKNDERRAATIFMAAMSIASAIATMYSMTVFYTLYFTMLALWGVLYFWYSKKM